MSDDHLVKVMLAQASKSMSAGQQWLATGSAKEANREFKYAMKLIAAAKTVEEVREWWVYKHPEDFK